MMTKGRIALVVGSVGATFMSGLAFAMWIANGIVYGSLIGLKDREHDVAIVHEKAAIALTAAILLQAVAMYVTASWLPRPQLGGVIGTMVRFVLALALSLVGAGVALAFVLQVGMLVH